METIKHVNTKYVIHSIGHLKSCDYRLFGMSCHDEIFEHYDHNNIALSVSVITSLDGNVQLADHKWKPKVYYDMSSGTTPRGFFSSLVCRLT